MKGWLDAQEEVPSSTPVIIITSPFPKIPKAVYLNNHALRKGEFPNILRIVTHKN